MSMNWLKAVTDNLVKVLDKPPYLTFVFIGAVLVIVSLITNRQFDQVWVFFLYSAIGAVWRYAEKDLIRQAEHRQAKKAKLAIIIVYHIGNALLVWGLLRNL